MKVPDCNKVEKTFRYYGGRPGEELARGLLRDKRQQEEYSDGLSLQADKADAGKDIPTEAAAAKTKASKPDIDQDYWQNVIGEATINSVLEKMVSCVNICHFWCNKRLCKGLLRLALVDTDQCD